jgi:hypothetical protein
MSNAKQIENMKITKNTPCKYLGLEARVTSVNISPDSKVFYSIKYKSENGNTTSVHFISENCSSLTI